VKKLINHPEDMVREGLLGLAGLHPDILHLDEDFRFIRRRQGQPGKVALISGGGSGHEPLHVGFVGRGMLDAACPGHIFSSPTPDQILAAVEAVDGGAGVLFIVKNYEGDLLNFAMAAEMSSRRIETIVVDDDVAGRRTSSALGRRGVAGTLIVEKLLGAAAEAGEDMGALLAMAEHVLPRIRSMGVALRSCTIPSLGRPTFELPEDQMEMGVGIHGEAGIRRATLACADVIATEMIDAVLSSLDDLPGTPCLLLVNGLGGTPPMELHLMARAARKLLAVRGVEVVRSLAGTLVTSLDAQGCSLSLAMMDETMLRLWDAPVHTAALRWRC